MDVPPGVSTTSYKWNNNTYYSTASSPFSLNGSAKPGRSGNRPPRSTRRVPSRAGCRPKTRSSFNPTNTKPAGPTSPSTTGTATAPPPLTSAAFSRCRRDLRDPQRDESLRHADGQRRVHRQADRDPDEGRGRPSSDQLQRPAPVGTSSEFGVFVVTSKSMALAGARPAPRRPRPQLMGDGHGRPDVDGLRVGDCGHEPVAPVEAVAVDESVDSRDRGRRRLF